MSQFKTDMPNNIDDLTPGQVVDWISENSKTYSNDTYSPKQVGRLMLEACVPNGLQLSNSQFLFVSDNSNRILVEACAGAGKTTISQLKLVNEKFTNNVPGYKILTIAYNEHAAKDMERRHSEIVGKIKQADRKHNFFGHVTSIIRSMTFHSFMSGMVEEYKQLLDLDKTFITPSHEIEATMLFCIERVYKKYNIQATVFEKQISSIYEFNQLINEAMLTDDEITNSERFKDCGVSLDHLKEILASFEIAKRTRSQFEFIDQVLYFKKLLDFPDVLTRLQNMYQVILVDEYQDMSKLMRYILKKLVKEDTKLICIGDGDQAIYGFRGTDSLNCLKFKEDFGNDCRVYTMTENRRCRKEIVSFADYMIRTNYYRLEKNLLGIKDGGDVHNISYNTRAEQYADALEKISAIKNKTSYAAFRTNESVQIFSRYLLDANIPFKVKLEYEPFRDNFTKNLNDIFYLLSYPNNHDAILSTLYKLTPLKKSEVASVLKLNAKGMSFFDFTYAGCEKVSGLDIAIERLRGIASSIRMSKPLSEYFKPLYQMFSKYFWDWQKETRGFSPDLEAFIIDFYNQPRSLQELNEVKSELRKRMETYRSMSGGISLLTMHGLKGLEFDIGFIMDLNGSFPKDESKRDNKTPEEIQLIKEEEMRLLYVSITRSRDTVYTYWDNNNQSEFKKFADQYELLKSSSGFLIDDFEEGNNNLFDMQEDEEEIDLLLVSAEPELIVTEEPVSVAEEFLSDEEESNPVLNSLIEACYTEPELVLDVIEDSIAEVVEDVATVILEVESAPAPNFNAPEPQPASIFNLEEEDETGLPELVGIESTNSEYVSPVADLVKAYDETKQQTLQSIVNDIASSGLIPINEAVKNGVVNVQSIGTFGMSNNDRFIKILSLAQKSK